MLKFFPFPPIFGLNFTKVCGIMDVLHYKKPMTEFFLNGKHQNKHLQFIAVKLYCRKFSSDAYSDLNKNSGRLIDFAQKISRISEFAYPYSHPVQVSSAKVRIMTS